MDEQAGPPKVPRWVKVLGIVAGVIVVLAIAALAFGGGEHGPGRHLSGERDHSGDPNHTPPAGHGNSTSHHTLQASSQAVQGIARTW